MRALLIQPPFVQLNAPYPAIHYLAAFLRGRGHDTRALDHSIELYRRVFSRAGLMRLFDDARVRLASKAPHLRKSEAAEIERYFSYEPFYYAWIEGLVDFLSGGDPAFAHRLSSAAELPRGLRATAYLEVRDGRPGPDEARGLATAILEDLADFIRFTLDPEFGTVRYGERLAQSHASFDTVLSGLRNSYLITAFYRPYLDERLPALEAAWGSAPQVLLITIPFPGCLLGALAAAQAARAAFGPELRVIFGGGYVSTELRSLVDARLFEFCDYLSFDAGYGSLASILEAEGLEEAPPPKPQTAPRGDAAPLYRTMLRESGSVVAVGFPEGPDKPCILSRTIGEADLRRFTDLETEALSSCFPDYCEVESGRYLRVLDSTNPMHRLWSESPWLKYHLAHGCYWKKCSFCDVELDYVARYCPVDVQALARAADTASRRLGLYGIHFVDEAMPMRTLLAFARANRERSLRGERPFSFWGNARFDASWTEDRCEYLAAAGLVAVSGGIEIATEWGLALTGKGFDLAGLVTRLVAMKRHGLLVHAYLIYGFPGQSARDIVDSAETLRQLVTAGLIDSAFWHRFVLTRRSRLMAEWRAGKRPMLRPIDRGGSFATNDLEFAGESVFDAFSGPLEALLTRWLEGKSLERPAARSLGMPPSSVAQGLIESLIAKAESELDAARRRPPRAEAARAYWIAGRPRIDVRGEHAELRWAYRGELVRRTLRTEEARSLHAAIEAASGPEGEAIGEFIAKARLDPAGPTFAEIRNAGLVIP